MESRKKIPLKALLDILDAEIAVGNANKELVVEKITSYSKNVEPNSVFVAYKGVKQDGHTYIEEALKKNPALIVAENISPSFKKNSCPILKVKDGREALSKLSAWFYNYPSSKLLTVGVTGTNGKTTTCWLIYSLLNSLGVKTALISTIGVFYGKEKKSQHIEVTTPDSVSLQKELSSALQKECQAAVIEISSHSLDQKRVKDIFLNTAVFTNLTKDHLDYHKSMEDYFKAKRKIFSLLKNNKKGAVVNIENSWGEKLYALENKNALSVGRTKGEIQIKNKESSLLGTQFLVTSSLFGEAQGSSQLFGVHNLENIVCAVGALCSLAKESGLSFSLQDVVKELSQCSFPKGRLERVLPANKSTKELINTAPLVFIDYAHTGDALAKVLSTLKPLCKEKLWVVFGAGGNRDPLRRKTLAEAASSLADKIVVTSDNPRDEDPQSIINDIKAALPQGIQYEEILDRREAIHFAVNNAAPLDVVLIAGKGHEEYQIIKGKRFYFSDYQEAENALNQRNK